MDRRDLSSEFRKRFRRLLDDVRDDIPGFLRQTGMDRSALSQLRDPKLDRLPRAETLRRIAEATGVSVDWLLALENSREGRQELTDSKSLLAEDLAEGTSPLTRWQMESAGHKVRYVPATLPDMLSLSAQDDGTEGEEKVLTGFDLSEVDLEIAMPLQTLETLAARTGVWKNTPRASAQMQLTQIARLCEEFYPALRLHLFDGAEHFVAPFTVFGRMRAAVYVGNAYISVTGPDEVRFFTGQFDNLVRASVVAPDQIWTWIEDLRKTPR